MLHLVERIPIPTTFTEYLRTICDPPIPLDLYSVSQYLSLPDHYLPVDLDLCCLVTFFPTDLPTEDVTSDNFRLILVGVEVDEEEAVGL